MNPYGGYGLHPSFLEYGVPNDYILEALAQQYNHNHIHNQDNNNNNKSPPKERHDGTSPLPLGMDWSPPPINWGLFEGVLLLKLLEDFGVFLVGLLKDGDHIVFGLNLLNASVLDKEGRDTVWPNEPGTGWSYCVTIPSWTILSSSGSSSSVVFYRVQVGIQTPEAVTSTRGTLHRFSDFLNLFSELKKIFPKKNMPVPPSKKLLGTRNKNLNEERRSSLEQWMEKLLLDIDISRSAPVAIFLELEAAVRSSFNESASEEPISFVEYQPNSDISTIADTSSVISDNADEASFSKSENGTPKNRDLVENKSFETSEGGYDFTEGSEGPMYEDLKLSSNIVMTLSTEHRHKLDRFLTAMEQRLATAKADMEYLVSRLNQEVAVKQFLTTKVTDLELELETTTEGVKDTLQQAISTEKERYTQMQWDVDEFRKKCLELEMKLKTDQDEKARIESEKFVIAKENEMLKQELDAAKNSQKSLEDAEMKSKSDLKTLVKEVKSLRSSQSELKQDLTNVTKEKQELEKDLQNEKQLREQANSVNEKLLHECVVLQKRLQECSVDFQVEEGDKLILDTSSLSDALDLLSTSDNRIGLLLAEAQLLGEDVENGVTTTGRTSLDELRKMITDLFVDNASLRKQINAVIRCSLKSHDKTEEDEERE